MKTIAIIGASGLLGQNLTRVLRQKHRVLLFDKIAATDEILPVDITNINELNDVIIAEKPDVVINTAAFTNVDAAEDNVDLAYEINQVGVKNILQILTPLNIPLVHISTDYIFDGHNGPYGEEDKGNPNGVYAKSKWLGELEVQAAKIPTAIVRPNVLYGFGYNLKSSFVEWLISQLQKGNAVKIVNDQFNNPSYAYRLAELIQDIIEKDAWGIWHFGCDKIMSRYEFALEIADVFNLPKDIIQSVSSNEFTQKAPRPMRSGLKTEKVASELKFAILSAREELQLLKREIYGDEFNNNSNL